MLLLETICVSPVVFLVFAAWETPAPEHSGGERGGSYAAKTLENKGREHIGKRSTLWSVTSKLPGLIEKLRTIQLTAYRLMVFSFLGVIDI